MYLQKFQESSLNEENVFSGVYAVMREKLSMIYI